MKIKEVIAALERFAPLPLQEDWDNSGLQVGLTEADVSGALLCLDITENIVNEAIEKECNLIVSHHPLLFRSIKCISNLNEIQRCIIKAIKNDITIVSMHTNADNAFDGVNFRIAQKLHINEVQFLKPKMYNDIKYGSGVIGYLQNPLPPQQFIDTIKNVFNTACLHGNNLIARNISKVAICGGAGAFMLTDAICAGADAFITGEMGYHDYFDHNDDIQICVIGHYQSEQYTTEIFKEIIEKEFSSFPIYVTSVNTNPIKYY